MYLTKDTYRDDREKKEEKVLYTGLILGLRPANERRRYKVTLALTGWA